MTSPECAEIDEMLEVLALGEVAEPDRGRMLAHVAGCAVCRGRLDAMLALTDGLLALAPQHEPPAGFESRVLERMGASAAKARPTTPWWLAGAAAVVLVAAILGGVALGRHGSGTTAAGAVARAGAIQRADGARLGRIQLIDAATPYVLVTIDHPQQRANSVSCRLQLADGTSVVVGSWGYDDVKAGVWAVGIDRSLLAAVSMQIVDEQGTVLASATLA